MQAEHFVQRAERPFSIGREAGAPHSRHGVRSPVSADKRVYRRGQFRVVAHPNTALDDRLGRQPPPAQRSRGAGRCASTDSIISCTLRATLSAMARQRAVPPPSM